MRLANFSTKPNYNFITGPQLTMLAVVTVAVAVAIVVVGVLLLLRVVHPHISLEIVVAPPLGPPSRYVAR
jgi:hypothetical protein